MNTGYKIQKKITSSPLNKLISVYGKLALDKSHLELALRNKGIHALNHDIEQLNGITKIGAKLARTLRR